MTVVPTMQDVATIAGVSAKTVSRVFNDDPHVLPDTRERVERAMRELGYVPNVLARTFRAGRSTTVGIAVPDVVDPFFASVVRAVEDVCSVDGVTTLVTSIGDDPQRERAVVDALLRTQLMGLVIAPTASDQSWLQSWTAHTPIVFVDREPTGLDADAFVEDDREGARLAVAHLVSHGHRRIAFVSDATHPPSTSRRLDGWRAALTAAGIAVNDALVTLDADGEAGAERELARLTALPQPPTAVFSANARVTMAAFAPIARAGLALVGFGDFPMADRLTPSVTVIEQDPAALGRLAAERALARFRDADAVLPPAEPLPVRLLERASCRVGAA